MWEILTVDPEFFKEVLDEFPLEYLIIFGYYYALFNLNHTTEANPSALWINISLKNFSLLVTNNHILEKIGLKIYIMKLSIVFIVLTNWKKQRFVKDENLLIKY